MAVGGAVPAVRAGGNGNQHAWAQVSLVAGVAVGGVHISRVQLGDGGPICPGVDLGDPIGAGPGAIPGSGLGAGNQPLQAGAVARGHGALFPEIVGDAVDGLLADCQGPVGKEEPPFGAGPLVPSRLRHGAAGVQVVTLAGKLNPSSLHAACLGVQVVPAAVELFPSSAQVPFGAGGLVEVVPGPRDFQPSRGHDAPGLQVIGVAAHFLPSLGHGGGFGVKVVPAAVPLEPSSGGLAA